MRVNNIFLLIIFISPSYLKSQSIDSCLSFKEGFLVKVVERVLRSDQLVKSEDYFFFKNTPKINREESPITLFKTGGQVVDIGFYRAFNFERSMLQGFPEFDLLDTEPFTSCQNKRFTFKIYKVVFATSIRIDLTSEFVSIRNSSGTYSYLLNLSDEDLRKSIKIISPKIIRAW